MDTIVTQVGEKVKLEHIEVSADPWLEFVDFIAEETLAWDDHADEVAQAHLVSVGRG